ncbi:hypothetical protein TVAG_119630 [Trichomonas vaginalis G3]|uniref:Cornichon protein n=1 Tax=Trichomonas vaginalis (strain ATCC PRA-98 / G3) TaxID=412133 RepID=A2D7A9_TRIV3|nr:cornichon protein family [Trichomonas vaginalis G3]EAY23626.1 hypothetical protein TVAG_119630 [Trichomonas vaginalis G3]KAI5490118.1 cornichon protein family [Trichomonas vaginalis G3]|eukprot:XP_001276874.1 hypothetical protein [Trichomonas vaginalis G3]
MWFILLLGLIGIVALAVLYIIIINSLVDFQIDRINPLDICSTLDKFINPLKYVHIFVALTSLGWIKAAFPILIYHFLIAFHLYYTTRNRRYFEPLTIVRDSDSKKYKLIAILVGVVISFVYSMVIILLSLFD